MTKIAISSDTTCAIDPIIAKKFNLFLLPLNVIVNGVEYHDTIDMDINTLATCMHKNEDIKTSTPTPYEIEEYFKTIFSQGYDKIIHFTISSHLSSMFDLFTNRCNELFKDKVVVIDSLAVCSLMLNQVLTAVELNKNGKSVEEIVEAVKDFSKDSEVYFIPENLNALKKGGRISPVVALLGNMIGLKPVLSFKEGKIEKAGTTRRVKQELADRIKDLFTKFPSEKYDYSIVLFDTVEGLVKHVENCLLSESQDLHYARTDLSLNVSAHVGPGTIGIIVCKKIADKYNLVDYLK